MRSLLIVVMLSVALAACGKKPSSLRPDDVEKATTHPRTYPIK